MMLTTAKPLFAAGTPLAARIALALAAIALTGVSAPAWSETHQFQMTIEEGEKEVAPGFSAKVWAYNGQVPGPLIRVEEGDTVEVELTNMTTLAHTIHWHGTYQTGTWRNDGVPDVTQQAVQPGDSFTYKFVADKPGSLWYHCHVNVPEHVGLRGMWGPMIVDPKEPVAIENEVTKEAILMFSGWNEDVAQTFGKGGHPTEKLSYFSINGQSFPNTQPLRVKEGDVLRLRLYATGIETAFHLHGHDMLVTHKDGLPLDSPFWADVVDINQGERYDVIVRMDNPGRWIAHDHIEHHVSNNGKVPGGAVMIVEYDSIEDDDWYVWKDKSYDPNFYYTQSLAEGSGLFNHKGFEVRKIENDKSSDRGRSRGRSQSN